MATLMVTGQKGVREDLLDLISYISETQTHFLSTLPKRKVSNTYVQWQTQALPTPATNTAAEGAAWSAGSVTATSVTANRTQISKHCYTVSETMLAMETVGRSDEMAYLRKNALMHHAREIEYALLNATAGTSGNNRQMRGIRRWAQGIATNIETGSGTGTSETLTESMFVDGLERIWITGLSMATMSDIYVNSFQKRKIAGFKGSLGNATVNVDQTAKKLTSTVNYYESDYGVHAIHLHDLATSTEVLILTKSDYEMGVLRPTEVKEVLPGAVDGRSFGIVTEYTVICRTNRRSGKITGLATS